MPASFANLEKKTMVMASCGSSSSAGRDMPLKTVFRSNPELLGAREGRSLPGLPTGAYARFARSKFRSATLPRRVAASSAAAAPCWPCSAFSSSS
jgi:hypothetical protein